VDLSRCHVIKWIVAPFHGNLSNLSNPTYIDIVPIYKRDDQEKATNYKEISLLCTAYKLYAEMLKNRLEKEVEEKRMILET